MHSGTFLGDIEKSSFFDDALGRRKNNKNGSLESPETSEGSLRDTRDGPGMAREAKSTHTGAKHMPKGIKSELKTRVMGF